jgi:hypothetical protein
VAATAFGLKYRGLSVPDDSLSYRAYWSWGGFNDLNDPFVQAVKSRVREFTLVYNGSLPNAKWAVVGLKNKRPVAFDADTDSDGKLSDQERLAPPPSSREGFGYSCAFISPDFLCAFSWPEPNIQPGRYTITMTQETGPLAGKLDLILQ